MIRRVHALRLPAMVLASFFWAGLAFAQGVTITVEDAEVLEADTDLEFTVKVTCTTPRDPFALTLKTQDGAGPDGATGGNNCNQPNTDYLSEDESIPGVTCNSELMFSVTICEDDEVEMDEVFRLVPSTSIIANNNAGDGTILNDDEDEEPPPPGTSKVTISIDDTRLREGETATITIRRTGDKDAMAEPAGGLINVSPVAATPGADERDFVVTQEGLAQCAFDFAGTNQDQQTAAPCEFLAVTPDVPDDPPESDEEFALTVNVTTGKAEGGDRKKITIAADRTGGGGGGGDDGDDDDGDDDGGDGGPGPVLVDLTSPFAVGTPQRSVGGALQNACTRVDDASLNLFCIYLRDTLDGGQEATPADGQRAQVVRELTPVDIAAQADIAIQAARGQLESLDDRMRQVRRGNREKVGARLAMNLGGQPLLLDSNALLGSLQSDEDEWDPLAGLLSPMPARQDAGGSAGYGTVDDSRVRYFVAGRASMGSHDETALEEDWDLTSAELTVGIDKLLADAVLIGGALGYFTSETDFDGDGGVMDTRGFSLGLYSMYYYGNFFVSGSLGYGDSDLQSIRNVRLPVPFGAINTFTPRASPGGEQSFGSVSLGWDRKKTKSTLGVFLRGSWINVDIDGYVETDGGPINMAISDQEAQSLIAELGVDLAYTAEYRWGVMRPSVRVSAMKEFENGSRQIVGDFELDAASHNFVLFTDDPDEEFYRVGAGLTAAFFNGGSLYVFYDTQLDRDDHDYDTFTVGLNLDF